MTKGTLEPPWDTSLGWGLCPRGWAQGPLLWLLHRGHLLGWAMGLLLPDADKRHLHGDTFSLAKHL